VNEETVRAWIVKAEEDLKIGQDELATEFPAWSGVAFHMQQCAEKYLKAYLTFRNRAFRKTHDISELLQICIEVDESFTRLQEANVDELTLYAVEVRYPSDFPTPNTTGGSACASSGVNSASIRSRQTASGRDDVTTCWVGWTLMDARCDEVVPKSTILSTWMRPVATGFGF